MEYVNFYVAIPLVLYAKLEHEAYVSKCSKNEILIDTIVRRYASGGVSLDREKNAGFHTLYNKK